MTHAAESSPVTWTDAPFQVASKEPVRNSPIRAAMLTMLLKAGTEGVLWQKFGHLDWQQPFSRERLDKAMSLLSSLNGIALQYQGDRSGGTYPFRWRLAP